MAQRLIVEGKEDRHVIANICKKRLPFPKGYANKKYLNFYKEAQGIDRVEFTLVETLNQPGEFTNVGIIVDADESGPAPRLDSLKRIIEKSLEVRISPSNQLTETGFLYKNEDLDMTIGIWIMPDNLNPGYLEHFVAQLLPPTNSIWDHSEQTIQKLLQQDYCAFKPTKAQKALVHTYLAWQKDPGRSIGQGIRSNYFDANAPLANRLVQWFEQTFELENGQ